MAKRSDFAQKLLDDLRTRKERLATSQSSNRASPMLADANAHSKRTYKGSREMKTHEPTGYSTGSAHNRSSRGNKSLIIGEASNQIVPFGRGQSSKQRGDLSMALAFAIENGGKIIRMDSSGSSSMLDFLHQIGRRSTDYGMMERRSSVDRYRPSTSKLPTISHLHIKEISKGAQKLNQILRACSDGLNFDKYSIEIGKELLKGAIDLEGSLRTLVNLQEASDYMVSPHRKSRITLLDEDEDDVNDSVIIAEQKQVDRPKFSFDKPSRNYHDIQEVARTDLKLRLAALTYPSGATYFNHENQTLMTSGSSSHKRSTSYGSIARTPAALSEQKNHFSSSQSKSENVRIPNVIAKLMGLDVLPQNENSKHTAQKDSSSKPKIEGVSLKDSAQRSTKKVKQTTKSAENMASSTVKTKMIQANKIPAIHDNIGLQAEKNLATRSASYEAVIHDGKLPWKELVGVQPVSGSKNTTIKIDKQQTQLSNNTGIRKDIQEKERKQDNRKQGDQKGTEKCKAANELLKGNHQKPQNSLGSRPPHMPQKSEPQERSNQADEREQQNAKQKLQMRKHKGSESISNILSKPMHDEIYLQNKQAHMNRAATSKKSSSEAIHAMLSNGFPNGRQLEDLARHGNSTNLNVNMKDSISRNINQNSSSRDLESELAKGKAGIPSAVEEKPHQVAAKHKAKDAKLHKSENPRKINEVMSRRDVTPQNLARPLKHQSSIAQEVKQRRRDKLSSSKEADQVRVSRSKEAEVRIIKSNKSITSIQPSNVAQDLQKEAQQASILYSPVADECQSLKEPQILSPNDSCQNIISVVTNNHRGEELVFGRDEELNSDKIVLNPLKGTHEGSMDISYPSQLEHQKISKLETRKPLTESENHLKQILIKNQLFLNTAEALFELNTPIGILHVDGHDCQGEDSKLILDCGYEVMKRKGRRQEHSVHPCVRISITSMKVRSLDDLAKQLHKDLEKLKFYGRDGCAESVVEDYLPKMLESDIYNCDPDVNCMWDLGWNEISFIAKDDVVREVEKYVLNGLIDEITRDLLHI